MADNFRRIAIVTDAYYPHVSGVARTIEATCRELTRTGHTVKIIAPRDFPFKIPAPLYPEIDLTLFPDGRLWKMLDEFNPSSLHIAVEGPLGLSARAYAKKRGIHFTTAYHTRFPEYLKTLAGIPESWTYGYARWFHGGGDRVMVTAENIKKELEDHGFKNCALWSRGVDFELFKPENPMELKGEKPIFMYMGRVSHEKNIETFLSLDVGGTKYVVGDGPAKKMLEKKYPDTIFTGYKFGEELARHIAAADVFVFPSLTDTFGLVMLEANACGTPVAALPSQASRAVVREGKSGCVREDLKEAIVCALKLDRKGVREVALQFGWDKPTKMFIDNLVPTRT